MASRHELALDILPTLQQVLRISDASTYTSLLDIDCPQLDILIPEATAWVQLSLVPRQILTASLSDLKVKATELPDGLYTIRYAVSPHEKTRITVYHLRTTKLQKQLLDALCGLQVPFCEPSREHLQHIKELRQIELYLKAAVAKVEQCNQVSAAIELYNYAQTLLTRYLHHCPSCHSCR